MISIITNYSPIPNANTISYSYSIPQCIPLNEVCLSISPPTISIEYYDPLIELSKNYCLCDLERKMEKPASFNPNFANFRPMCYNYVPMSFPTRIMSDSNKEDEITWVSSSKNIFASKSGIYRKFQKRDMVNYKVLEGHKYQIVDNPEKEKCANKRLYICKYGNCNKIFTKTWNLVSHFRIHTNEKPYQCSECHKLFTQRSNLSRHLAIHCKSKSIYHKIHKWTECPRKYSSIYNLNVSGFIVSSQFICWSFIFKIRLNHF